MSDLPDRLFALLDLLRGQSQLTTGALAERLGVSERTVRRDLRRLETLEIEVETRPGRRGGVTLSRGALLPALRFTEDEALVLALGLERGRTIEDARLAGAATTAFARLQHVMTGRVAERIEALLHAVSSEETPAPPTELASGALLDLAEAVRQRRRVTVRYRSPEGSFTRRPVDPYGIVQVNGRWYTIGYCHLRRDLRTFRVDRLRAITLTDDTFEPPEAFDPLQAVSASLAQNAPPGGVTYRVVLFTDLADASRHVPAYAAALEPVEDGVLLTASAHPAWLRQIALHLLDFPFPVQVLEPAELREALEGLASRAHSLAEGAKV